MPRGSKNAAPLSKAEVKAQKDGLKTQLKELASTHNKYVADSKAADKAVADANKARDKAVAAATKEGDTAVKSAMKAQAAANAKLDKATKAYETGKAKLEAKLAELSPTAADAE